MWYRGTRFRGYQRQPVPNGPTVQQAIEEALARLGLTRTPSASGRTDLGVHARMQVLSVRHEHTLLDGALESLRSHLDPDVGVVALKRAPPKFHAQWSSRGKEYRYRVQLRGAAPPAWQPYVWELASDEPALGPIDEQRWAALFQRCVGRRDFIAFHEKSSPRKERLLESVEVVDRGGGLFDLRFRGEGFGRYQVRYLVGTTTAVAAGRLPEEAFVAALDRGEPIAGLKAPARGLCLWEVRYDPTEDPFLLERTRGEGIPGGPPFE
jgi:tRNA pseudouridine38-40 synthase